MFGALSGPLAAYDTRLGWVRNLVAAGGLRLIAGDPGRTVDENVRLFRESGARSVIIVSSDALYPECVPALAAAYRAAGAADVWLAGQPRDRENEWRAAGVGEFVFAGADVHRLLGQLLAGFGAQS